ncbi:MAG TPA: FecR domain-containing protein, partial [Stellaceae bacterium]|nr:FecR domain-containing protein [Stellaceae bacterium]
MALLMGRPGMAADERVGVNSAVNPAGTGTLPSGPTRQLVIGQDIVFKERVDTTAIGQTQIMFLDESSMSVGPNSDMVIDEFVYDPNANSGKLAMSATRGVFRYVGGKISKLEGGVSVDTPVASIGIRGGAFEMSIVNNRLDIVFIYGKGLAVTGRNGVSKVILRPGYRITVGPDGNPSDPYKATEDFIATLSAALDGRPGGNGGAREIPTDRRVVISGIGNVISGRFETNLLAALKAAGFSCGGAVGLQAVAGRLSLRCSSADDPGDLQTAFQENDVIQRQRTRVSTNTPTPTPT